MAVLLAPLGFTPEHVMAPVRDYPEIRQVHVFYGEPAKPETTQALQAARKDAKAADVELVEHGVPGAFDYQAILNAMLQVLGTVRGQVYVNASGGTRVMVMAATICAYRHGLKLLYYDEYESTKGQEIPLGSIGSVCGLGRSQKQILLFVQQHGVTDMGTLARRLRLAPSTVTQHIQQLQQLRLLHYRQDGRRRLVEVPHGLQSLDLEALA